MREAMSDGLKRSRLKNSKVPLEIEKIMAKDNACYVLIACGQPSEDGKMQVEMTYEGDACLAAYLIESAQGFIDHEIDMNSLCSQ